LRKGGNLKHSAWASNNQYEKIVWKENKVEIPWRLIISDYYY